MSKTKFPQDVFITIDEDGDPFADRAVFPLLPTDGRKTKVARYRLVAVQSYSLVVKEEPE